MSFPPARDIHHAESLRFIHQVCFTRCPWTGPYPRAQRAKWRLAAHVPGCPIGAEPKRRTWPAVKYRPGQR